MKPKRPKTREDELMDKMGRCPKGHQLPHRVNSKNCTPLACGGKALSKKERAAGLTETAGIPRKPADLTSLAEQEEEVRARLLEKVSILKAKRAFFGIPEAEALDKDSIDGWIDEKLLKLGIDAVAELEEQLKLGSSEDRRITAFKILDALGKGKKDAVPLPPQTIHVHINQNELPWAQRVVEPAQTPKLPDRSKT
jgi:hypothetical protein